MIYVDLTTVYRLLYCIIALNSITCLSSFISLFRLRKGVV